MKYVLLSLACLAAPAAAQDSAPFTVAETGHGYARLDDAVKAIGSGSGTITVAPGSYRDCAVFAGGTIAIRAATPSTAIFDGGACEGKATLVLRGLAASLDGIVFQHVRVADRNGAGIRLEHGDLTVTRSTFRDSEQGILTADDPGGSITVDHSTFSGLGGCPEGMCSHSIYVGGYGSLTVTRSRFERGTGGHYVKSRAARTEVTDSSFDDTQGRATNYMIDLPSGSVGRIAGNVFVQGRDKENYSALIAVAAEARDHPSAGLVVEGNDASIAPGVSRQTVFVADWSHEALRLGANRLGAGIKAFETR
ncbi:MAG: right-handed parallel beta-helix repeat-containing protein [Sphingomonadaceae bacterium]|nr:right-handed parallel beta-helix repeat-containing protein [Sphingomonadaceae bacterium]